MCGLYFELLGSLSEAFFYDIGHCLVLCELLLYYREKIHASASSVLTAARIASE